MDKELQNSAWSVLPKEFKEEVKREYYHDDSNPFELAQLEAIFGIHNLISDTEEEGELLTVSRSKVQRIFAGQTEIQKNTPCKTILHYEAAAKTELLYTLFDSKCLPDNSKLQANCGQVRGSQSAEPKFKVGYIIKLSNSSLKNGLKEEWLTIDEVDSSDNTYLVHSKIMRSGVWIQENEIGFYAEPKMQTT